MCERFAISMRDLLYVWEICYMYERFTICMRDLLYVWEIYYMYESFSTRIIVLSCAKKIKNVFIRKNITIIFKIVFTKYALAYLYEI